MHRSTGFYPLVILGKAKDLLLLAMRTTSRI